MLTGLTSNEVKERKSKGEVNSVEQIVSRSYKDIIVKNVFTTFNVLLFIMGAILVIVGEPIDAVAATGVITLNIIVATIQEIRAKRRLDKIALLMRPKVTVLRDGKESVIDQSEVVKDDIIVMNPGDQALVDGELLEMEYLEMDESLLTGESSTVRKHVGDVIYSGSYCITGSGAYKVTAFGDETFASKMLASAKKYTTKMTPLQMETSAITKVLMVIAFVFMAIMIVINLFKFHGLSESLEATVKTAVIILDIVPIALFLLIVIAYMVAAVRMADGGVLLQRSSAVESLSHVDTVCMDKTGTITTNKLVFKEMKPYRNESETEELIRSFANSTGSKNRTVTALIERFGKADVKATDEIRFSSERKYSAVKIACNGKNVTIFMGALSSLGPHIDNKTDVEETVKGFSEKGLRTIIIAEGPDMELYGDENVEIPELSMIAVIAIEDEVRSDCKKTIETFLDNEMDLKVISGDDPETVNALFTIAQIPGERKILSGDQLDALQGEERKQAILTTNIFGRMKPDHKEQIIETLKNEGRYVAMVGDGVNDVKSLKMAQVGVALQSGSGAARGVADMVLVDDNFAALPKALVEGRKTVSGMRDILKLYLSRNFVLAIMVALVLFIFGNTPFLPTQATFYAIASVSIAAFLMTIWAKPSENKGAILPGVLKYAIPMAVMIAGFGFAVYLSFYYLTIDGVINIPYTPNQIATLGWPVFDSAKQMPPLTAAELLVRTAEINARNSMLLFVILAGITQLLIITPYFKFFSVDGKLHKDIKPTILVGLLYLFVFAVYYAVYTWEWAAKLVSLAIFPVEYILCIIAVTVVWFFVARTVLRKGGFKRLTSITEKWYRSMMEKMYDTNGGDSENVSDKD